jgi:DNA-binding NtrC family response regulator
MRTKSVLVVDDEELLREIIGEAFDYAGYRVSLAKCGDEAWEKLEVAPVDVVVSDVRMPNGDGVQLLHRIKQLSYRPIVIMMSGYSDLTETKAHELGAKRLFHKPFNPDDLINEIESIIQTTAPTKN